MRILVDITYARRAPFSGTAVYLERVQDALTRIDGVEVVTAFNPRRRSPASGGLGSARNLLADGWWTAIEIPRLARRMQADVIHHPLPAFSRRARAAQVVTVHDLAFERIPEHFDRAFRLYARRTHRAAACAAEAVLCVSETTAVDVRELWGVASDRIVVALHGPGQPIALEGDTASTGQRRHFLYVGDDQPRKNVGTLLAAYQRYRAATSDSAPVPLVLAGSATAEAPGILVERHPSRERLAELYATAVALVHPSFSEGFGLTALEAMSAGAPVLAANTPGLREVCGQAALYADARDPDSFAAVMARMVREPELREELAARGSRRVTAFSWERCARAHVDAYSLAQKRA